MKSPQPELVPLSEAAFELRLSKEGTLRRILTRRLAGRKLHGFWYVERAALVLAKEDQRRQQELKERMAAIV